MRLMGLVRVFDAPFRRDYLFFLILWALASSADFFYWTVKGKLLLACYLAAFGFIQVYILSLLSLMLPNRPSKFIRIIFVGLGCVNLLADSAAHDITDYGFTSDTVAIILGTNFSESLEFIKMYINIHVFLFITSIMVVGLFIFWRLRKCAGELPRVISESGVVVTVILFISFGIVHARNTDGVFLRKINLFCQYEPSKDLRPLRKEYDLVRDEPGATDIVVIIGESLSKSHMGLYGYSLNTTPNLDSLFFIGDLIRCDSVKTYGLHTIQSFKYMMTSLISNDPDDDWYNKDKMIDIFHSAGYQTAWISNQSSTGVYDNIVARFSELCDTVVWCGGKFRGMSKHDFDEIVVPEFSTMISSMTKPGLSFVHLMGSHENFENRYPDDFAVFSKDDYPVHSSVKTRSLLAAYDNSVLYNDFVVGQLIETVKDRDAILLYFSDHGLDVFDSSEEYIGHAKPGNPVSVAAGQNIPFIVYMSPTFRESHQDLSGRINSSCGEPFVLENLMYTIMDIAGVRFADDNRVDSLSLFRKRMVLK